MGEVLEIRVKREDGTFGFEVETDLETDLEIMDKIKEVLKIDEFKNLDCFLGRIP